jgi:hypothetical protein
MPKKLVSHRTDGSTFWVEQEQVTSRSVSSLSSERSGHEFLIDIVWDRPNFHESACISATLDAALQVSNTKAQDIDLFDIYS